MTTVFTTNPVKLNVMSVRNNRILKKYVFIGVVPKAVEKELIKLQQKLASKSAYQCGAPIKNFYGESWAARLGVGFIINPKSTQSSTRNGGLDLIEDMIGDADNEFSFDSDLPDKSKIITDEELEHVISGPTDVDPSTLSPINDIFREPSRILAPSAETHASTSVCFIFDDPRISIYPFDKVSEFKKKIYVAARIPIYRQHIWISNRSVSVPLSYNLIVGSTFVPVDIRSVSAMYVDGKLNPASQQVENIPIDVNMYNAYERIKIEAHDTFKILDEYYTKYDTVEFNVADLEEFINPANKVLVDSILSNKQQTNMVYYGFVVMYWPMLTVSAFKDFLKGENSIKNFYPELYHDVKTLTEMYSNEKDIIDASLDLHSKSNEPALAAITSNIVHSITSAVMHVSYVSNLKENVIFTRNLFDKIELSDRMPACRCFATNEDKTYILDKVYKGAEPIKETLTSQGIVFRIIPNDTDAPIIVVFYKNGNYVIKSNWRDEAYYGFDSIFKEAKRLVDPLVSAINKLAPFVLYEGKTIYPITKYNSKFVEIGLIMYYKQVFTESQFAFLRHIMEEFRNAGILDSRSLEKSYAEYYFKKGMYQFDPRRLEKVSNVKNYYDHMSDGTIKQKWFTIFEKTRITKIWHRFSDIKIEIYGIKEKEFVIFLDLITAMFHMYETRKKDTVEDYEFKKIMKKKEKKALTNLKEQDPVLYDFKKMYKSTKVYSRICQKAYQPILINKFAYEMMPSAQKKKVVKYWNFTTDSDAYYHCPNPKYPYIKFITKTHPKDYCIPCCKKIDISPNVADPKTIIHDICMKDHEYSKERKTVTLGSKYIMTYGKDVEVGRLSKLPEDSMEGIFYETFSMEHGSTDQSYMASDGFYVYGTAQHTANVSDVGYVYSLAHSLDLDIGRLVDKLIAAIKSSPGIFNILLNGRITQFISTCDELTDYLLDFKNNEADILTDAHHRIPWNKLFIDLAFSYLNVNTILFQQSGSDVELRLPNGLEDAADYISKSKKNLIVIQKGSKYYPVYLINTDLFFKLGLIEKKTFVSQDGIIKIIENITKNYIKTVQIKGKSHSTINLIIVKEFLKNTQMSAKYKIHKLFINHSNLCYGVQFHHERLNKLIYVPIEQSYYSFELSPSLEFEPYKRNEPKSTQTFEDLMIFINDFNNWVDIQSINSQTKKDEEDIYPIIKVELWLVLQKTLDFQHTDKVIGFRSSNLNYYFADMSHSEAIKHRRIKSTPVFYDPDLVNSAIHRKLAPKSDKRTEGKSRTLYKYNAYQLFLLEFITAISKQKNIPVRTQLKKMLAADFVKNAKLVNTQMLALIKDSADLLKIRMQISEYVNNHRDRKRLFADIDNSTYRFDDVALNKLTDTPLDALKREIKKICKDFVKIGKIPTDLNFPNMFASCERSPGLGYCDGKYLLLDRDKLDIYIDVLANDILNPVKQKWIFSDVMSDRVLEFLQFVSRPNEAIFATLTSEH